ncbi:MAG: hypothetical protein U1E17_06920 [Geminicoccaceae bacterium]
MLIRDETTTTSPAIGRLITEAFLTLAQSTGPRPPSWRRCGQEGALALLRSWPRRKADRSSGRLGEQKNIVEAEEEQGRGGAPSKVIDGGDDDGGVGLGSPGGGRPCAVARDQPGAVLVGDPAYYGRLGLGAPRPGPDRLSPEVVQALPFDGTGRTAS